MKKRYYVLFKGRVQGVGFRFTVMMKARELNLTGSIRNLDNGDVEAYFEGDEKTINSLIIELYRSNGFIQIEDYFIKEVPIINDKDFTITY